MLHLCISRGEKIIILCFRKSVSRCFKHIICIYILQCGKKSTTLACGSSCRVCFSLYNLNEFYWVKMSMANQSSQSPVAADRWFRAMLLCVWICLSLLTKELPFVSDLWHKHLKRSCDYPEGDSSIVIHYNR